MQDGHWHYLNLPGSVSSSACSALSRELGAPRPDGCANGHRPPMRPIHWQRPRYPAYTRAEGSARRLLSRNAGRIAALRKDRDNHVAFPPGCHGSSADETLHARFIKASYGA